MFNRALVESRVTACHCRGGVNTLSVGIPNQRHCARIGAMLGLALIAGCQTKPTPPPGMTASVEVGAPLKAEAWKTVATSADEDRLSRLGLAWQEALAEAKRANAADVRREGKLLMPRASLPRPA